MKSLNRKIPSWLGLSISAAYAATFFLAMCYSVGVTPQEVVGHIYSSQTAAMYLPPLAPTRPTQAR